MPSNKKILLTGGAGFLGKFVVQELIKQGYKKENIFIPRSKQLDLRKLENCQKAVRGRDIVIHLAGNVGGIGYNREKPGELFYDNLMMGVQLMETARQAGVKKFVTIGTVCAYPKHTPVPFREEDLWNGYPEETNAAYGLAKKMLLTQSQAYRQQYGFNSIFLLSLNLPVLICHIFLWLTKCLQPHLQRIKILGWLCPCPTPQYGLFHHA